jgi:hypothetical protein
MKAILQFSFLARCFIVLVFVPALSVLGYLGIRSGKPLRPNRERYYIISAVEFFILLITLWAARSEGIVLLGREWGRPEIGLITAVYAALILWRGRRAWARMSAEHLEKARRLIPDDPSLMRRWVLIAAIAGIREECADRGLAYQLLFRGGLKPAGSLTVCAIGLAIGPMAQGGRRVLGAFLIAWILRGLVFLTNSLGLASAFHAAFNRIVGAIAMPVLSRFAQAQAVNQVVEV